MTHTVHIDSSHWDGHAMYSSTLSVRLRIVTRTVTLRVPILVNLDPWDRHFVKLSRKEKPPFEVNLSFWWKMGDQDGRQSKATEERSTRMGYCTMKIKTSLSKVHCICAWVYKCRKLLSYRKLSWFRQQHVTWPQTLTNYPAIRLSTNWTLLMRCKSV